MVAPSDVLYSINCAQLEANTILNSGWPSLNEDMVYRYPGVPTTGTVQRSFRDLCRLRRLTDVHPVGVSGMRAELCQVVLDAASVPAGLPLSGPTVVGDHSEYVVRMSYEGAAPGYDAFVWFFARTGPAHAAGARALFVHGGHGQGPRHADVIDIREEARTAGYDVFAFTPPGYGPNAAAPEPGYGYVANANPAWLSSHQAIIERDRKYLAQDNWGSSGVPPTSGWYAFNWPIHCMLNAVAASYPGGVYATGLSLGAAQLLLASACDTRIRAHYHVAGSGVPRYAHYHLAANFGDAENQVRSVLAIANDEEQNLLACSDGRRVLHVLNDSTPGDGLADDPGAFNQVDVTKYGPAIAYDAPHVVNGRWGYHLATNPTHTWSSAVRAMIFADIDEIVKDRTTRFAHRRAGLWGHEPPPGRLIL